MDGPDSHREPIKVTLEQTVQQQTGESARCVRLELLSGAESTLGFPSFELTRGAWDVG